MVQFISRRRFCATIATAVTGCRLGSTGAVITNDGRITARPGIAPTTTIAPGIHDLAVVANSDRHCWLLVPAGYDPSRAWPLTLFFRGAVTPARFYMDNLKALADEVGLIILAPEATGRTWDLVLGGFGPDVDFINAALRSAYQKVHVDPARILTSGFSDGASYSLSLGLTNGDFFTKIVAYSPGFMQASSPRGGPAFFITHGTMDQVLPIEASRYIAQQLRSAGYEVDFREFDGPHGVSLPLARASFEWLVGRESASR